MRTIVRRTLALALAVAGVMAGSARGDSVRLLEELRFGTEPRSSYPRSFALSSNGLVFTASTPDHGRELRRVTDFNTGAFEVVKDVYPGRWSGAGFGVLAVGSIVFFSARDDGDNYELWRTDGTSAGTVLVEDICPGTCGSWPRSLTNIGGILYFFADDGTNGVELWRSDGTAAGTFAVTSFTPTNPSFAELTNFNGTAVFLADDGTHGRELWKYSTASGSSLLKDITPGSDGTTISFVRAASSYLFFSATTAANGAELWKSSGSSASTEMVKDIVPGSGSSSPRDLQVTGSTVQFSAQDSAGDRELYQSYGTLGGTYRIQDLCVGCSSDPRPVAVMGTNSYWSIASPSGAARRLVRTDGVIPVVSGNLPSANTWINAAAVLGSSLLFVLNDQSAGVELWSVTPGGLGDSLTLLKELDADDGHDGREMYADGTRVVFAAPAPGTGEELWTSLGTAVSTTLLCNIAGDGASSSPSNFAHVGGDTAFFQILGGGAFTDGTSAGTNKLNTLDYAVGFRRAGEKVVFAGINSPGPVSLWSTGLDGCCETMLLPEHPSPITTFGNVAILNAGDTLYATDGTLAGTDALGPFSSVSNFTPFAGRLYFTTDGAATELWSTDGTAAGTTEHVISGLGAYLVNPTDFNGQLLYFTPSGAETWRLMKISGTTASIVFTINNAEPPGKPVVMNGYLWFWARHNGDPEVWRSNGTSAGTSRVTNIHVAGTYPFGGPPGFEMFPPLVPFGGSIYTTAFTEAAGYELWKTSGGTGTLVRDLCPGTCSSAPEFLTTFLNRLYFVGNDGTSGEELWSTDGTSAGTTLVYDLSPGSGGGTYNILGKTASSLYLEGYNGALGLEPYIVCGDTTALSIVPPAYAVSGATTNVSVAPVGVGGISTPCFTGIVAFSTGDGSATVPPPVLWGQGQGKRTVAVTFRTLGTQNFTASNATLSGSAQITVGPSPTLSTVTVTSTNAQVSTTTGISVTVQYRNAAGTNLTTTGGLIPVITAGPDVVVANFTNNNNGSFTALLRSTRAHSATVQVSVAGQTFTTQPGITFTPGAMDGFALEATAARPGQPFTLTVRSVDSFGNLVAGYAGTAQFTSSDATASLPAPASFSGHSGLRTFSSVVINTSGAQSITTTDMANASLDGTVNLSVRYQSAISVSTFPNPSTYGENVGISIVVNSHINGPVITGVVALLNGGSAFDTGTLANLGGGNSMAMIVRTLDGGAYSFTATYPGDTHHEPAQTAAPYIHQGMLHPPQGVTATGISSAQIRITWLPSAATDDYEVFRAIPGGSYVSLGAGEGHSFTDSGRTPNAVYLYKVRAIDMGGYPGAFSDPDAAVAALVTFTDDPIIAGTTTVKAQHITDLQGAVNALRAAVSMSAFAFTEVPALGGVIKRVHVLELRTARNEALAALGVPPVTGENTLAESGTVVRAADVTRLRETVQ